MSGGMIIIDTSGLAYTVMTTNGDIVYYNGGRARLPKGSDGEILELSGGFPSWEAAEGLSLGSKGDIHTRSATAQAALSIGSNGQILEADSTTTTGLKWATASGGATVTTNEIHPTADFSTSSTSFVDATNYDTTIVNETGGGFIASGIVGWYNTNNGSDNSSYKLVHGTTSQGITQVNNNFPKQGGTPISLPIEFMGSTDGNDLKIQAMVSMGTSTARGSGDFVHVSILEVA